MTSTSLRDRGRGESRRPTSSPRSAALADTVAGEARRRAARLRAIDATPRAARPDRARPRRAAAAISSGSRSARGERGVPTRGRPTTARGGFARGQEIPVEALERTATEKASTGARVHRAGLPVRGEVPRSSAAATRPCRSRAPCAGHLGPPLRRPIRWLVALQAPTCPRSGGRGARRERDPRHRFHRSGPFTVRDADDICGYSLKTASRSCRRAPATGSRRARTPGRRRPRPRGAGSDLLAEVSYLVAWPSVPHG